MELASQQGLHGPASGPVERISRFPLLRYYLWTSLVVIVAITLAVAFIFVRRAEQVFAERSSARGSVESAHFVQMFYLDVWAPSHASNPDLTLGDVIDPPALRAFADRMTFGLDIVTLNLLDLDGEVLWSSYPETRMQGTLDVGSFDTAVNQGTYSSGLRLGEVAYGPDGSQTLLDVVRTFAPIRDAPLDSAVEGNIVGVFEMDQDVTADLQAARRDSLIFAILGSSGMGAVLFTLLFLIVFKADRSISRGHGRLLTQQEDLAESEQRFRTVFEFAPIGIAMTDADGRITRSNRGFQDMVGYTGEELAATRFSEITHPDDLAENLRLFGALVSGELDRYDIEKRYLRKDRSIAWAQMAASRLPDAVFRCVAMVEDITQRKQDEKRLQEASRLASIGELSAGVAHEINNPLTTVMGFSKLLLARDLPADALEDLDKVYSETVRASRIVQSLLSFARRRDLEMSNIPVTSVLERALDLKALEFQSSGITVTTDWAQDLPAATVDEHQLLEVVLNILTNAQQSLMGSATAGAIGVRARVVSGAIRISISDDGPGIGPEQMSRIFDPFYTTKRVGQGTGLGLSICYGIVQQHGGDLWAESVPGEQTSFHIDLPLPAGRRASPVETVLTAD